MAAAAFDLRGQPAQIDLILRQAHDEFATLRPELAPAAEHAKAHDVTNFEYTNGKIPISTKGLSPQLGSGTYASATMTRAFAEPPIMALYKEQFREDPYGSGDARVMVAEA